MRWVRTFGRRAVRAVVDVARALPGSSQQSAYHVARDLHDPALVEDEVGRLDFRCRLCRHRWPCRSWTDMDRALTLAVLDRRHPTRTGA